MQLLGTAIVFDSPSTDLGGLTEIVKYQSVQKSLQRNNDVFMLWQHDSSQPLARTKTGSLKLTLTNTGLDFVVRCLIPHLVQMHIKPSLTVQSIPYRSVSR